ncbi:hypothetical protein CPC08DRAFT_824393 [Agrocybe pediades]|nr:hypothetical protein CPC08DRAFT_824393 [Agrocybe pediades]
MSLVTTSRGDVSYPSYVAPMISSSQGVLVTGGQFTQHYHVQASVGNKAPIDILTDAVATSALHDSGASFDKPKCHPRTRVKILEDVKRWILGEEAGKQIMWLYGAAGCGKSAIAQSIVESCIERGVLLASFFFNKSDSTRNHAGPLVATLAYQLYCRFPETEVQTAVLSAIKKDSLIFKKTLQQQFSALIIQPLRAYFSKDRSTQHYVPFLIVIDGLDECTDRAAQKAILTALADSVRLADFRIPIFVASRPEHDIKLSFSSKYLKDIHTHLSLDLEDGGDADSDIRLYLFDRFAEIKDDFDNRTTGRKLVQDWPGDQVIETLVRKAYGQFIYAAIVIRYVESTRHRPDHRLDIVLNLRPANGDYPFAELDSLYTMILESALNIEKVLHVLALYLMPIPPICFSVIEKLLSYDEGEVETLFCDMGALVHIDKPRNPSYDSEHSPTYLRILHGSFLEYMFDAARSKQFHIDKKYGFIRYVIPTFQYLVSYCCSSSFDPYSDEGAPIRCIDFYASKFSECAMDPEIREAVFSFPLKDFMGLHTGTRTYTRLLGIFISPFMGLLEIIVIKDSSWSYIRDHQLRVLRLSLMQQIERYFNDDTLALILVLFYHLGSDRFVPGLNHPYFHDYFAFALPLNLLPSRDGHDGDILHLYHIWIMPEYRDNVETGARRYYPYYDYVRELLRDPDHSNKCAVGPKEHEKAAVVCFKALANGMVPLPTFPCRTNDAHPKMIFDPSIDGGQWQFEHADEFFCDDEELYFLLLGYVIFLLPRCGRSDALIAACEEYRASHIIQPPDDPFQPQDSPFPPEEFFLPDDLFPVRRRLLDEEINNYLARVSSTS